MCGGSITELKGKAVSVYLGYHGGSIQYGDDIYRWTWGSTYEEAKAKDSEEVTLMREKMKGVLSSLSSEDLAEMILRIIDNADE